MKYRILRLRLKVLYELHQFLCNVSHVLADRYMKLYDKVNKEYFKGELL